MGLLADRQSKIAVQPIRFDLPLGPQTICRLSKPLSDPRDEPMSRALIKLIQSQKASRHITDRLNCGVRGARLVGARRGETRIHG